MPDANPLNDLGVALSRFWEAEKDLAKYQALYDKHREKLGQTYAEVGNGRTVGIVLDNKLWLLSPSEDGEFVQWAEMPWVVTDLTVPSRS